MARQSSGSACLGAHDAREDARVCTRLFFKRNHGSAVLIDSRLTTQERMELDKDGYWPGAHRYDLENQDA